MAPDGNEGFDTERPGSTIHTRDELERRVEELTAVNARLVQEVEEHRRAQNQLLQRNRELVSLQTAIAATAASLDLHFVLDTVTWEMTNLLEVERCVIFEWEQQANVLSQVAHYPPPDVLETEEPAYSLDLAEDPVRRRILAERSTEQTTVHRGERMDGAWSPVQAGGGEVHLLIPMVFQDRVVGLLEMVTDDTERLFTDHEISIAHLLANQAASAIENARLYEQAQREIARRKQAEERIQASLEEKEVLLKEIHHRVKNNLQVVSSLLYLQSQDVTDRRVLGMLQDSQNRIRSMALVHERLYRTEDLARIDFPEYVRDLTTYLVSSYNVGGHAVSLRLDADHVVLDVDTAVPCGLIVNELVSNSLKHAFPIGPVTLPGTASRSGKPQHAGGPGGVDGDHKEILIELRRGEDSHLKLIIGDNGVGFPEGMDWRNTPSLGLLLVNNLVRQLGGTIELGCGAGTRFEIKFTVHERERTRIPRG